MPSLSQEWGGWTQTWSFSCRAGWGRSQPSELLNLLGRGARQGHLSVSSCSLPPPLLQSQIWGEPRGLTPSLVQLPRLRPGPWRRCVGSGAWGYTKVRPVVQEESPTTEPALGPEHSHRNPYPRVRGQSCKGEGLRVKPGPHLPQSRGLCVSYVALCSSRRFPCPLGRC